MITPYIIQREENSSTFSIVREKPFSISVEKKHEKDVLEVFALHPDLLKKDKTHSLFETESIKDYIDDKWLYDANEWKYYNKIAAMNGKEITKLFVDYILEDSFPDYLEVCRWKRPSDMREIFSLSDTYSDIEILDSLMFLDFDTIEGNHIRISPQRVSYFTARGGYDYNFEKGVDWDALILAVRQRYNLKKEENKEIDYALSGGIERYTRGLVPHKKELIESIKVLAGRTTSTKSFKSEVKKLLLENNIDLNDISGSAGSGDEGYSYDIQHGFNKGTVVISIHNIALAYKGETDYDTQDMSTKLVTLKDDALWDAVYKEYQPSLF